ncbi:hypothetical protein COCCADRAFT_42188 [Bipolaris zeicola 26-R-13]|uniref:HAT C-terminal dimerisation domain-containing protein n=1 Tax=Cochliobolus carbonum (strain 26-R-13) TaxID=930089 RepID=W6XNQ6_COCC2|nr:uncharacterized protein COCCADRAFT_42188 [Bipolaris zeicola 26-R-13]EUC26885.1 hypothetical protein COCCADRAFT_42188 [Bipolaris zeicola 26-R-13]
MPLSDTTADTDPNVNRLLLNFLLITEITKERLNTRGRKCRGKTFYTYTINTANYVRNNHPVASRSTRSVSALACNLYIKDSLITLRRTIVQYITANYDFYSSEIKNSLTTTLSLIYIYTDLLTSLYRHSLLAVYVQWVDKDHKLCNNVTLNDTCLESIQRKLINRHRITFLLASSKEALVAALEASSGKAAAERNIAKRKNGEPARKHMRKGSTASNASMISTEDLSGVKNVPCQIINRVIRKKDNIQSFMSNHEDTIGDSRLLVRDWELLGKFILSKYCYLTEEVPVYAAALLLDSRKRIAYIKQNWPEKEHEDAIASATVF